MHHVARQAGLIALQIAGVLEGHPAIAISARVRIMRAKRSRALIWAHRVPLLPPSHRRRALLAEEIGKMRNYLGIKEGPHSILLDALHKEIGNPVGEIQIISAP